ncbi:MAG: phosphoribosyl-AMP cyclohydrolase [Methanocellales archaeon]|nr:phosphoribosyl-AMP cyclohydrolase [Methanocellales archaeon]
MNNMIQKLNNNQIEIVKFLRENGERSIRAISQELGQAYPTTWRNMVKLNSLGIVEFKIVGKSRMCSLNKKAISYTTDVAEDMASKLDYKVPPGLVVAVARDWLFGEILMVAFMNEEAVMKTLVTGEVHYWSRSREKLWKKGETSGNIQILKDVHVDCDADTLLLDIEQEGVACHTGKRSCFYRTFDMIK